MNRNWLVALCGVWLAIALTRSAWSQETPAKEAPRIQVAVLLDTSNSMDGLINQARDQLWRMVNEYAKTSLNGVRPRLEVAVYEYGNSTLPAESGFIREVLPFSENLDTVSRELFSLRTNGGSEHCGQVIERAVVRLKWSAEPRDMRCILIAGNEPFTQGPVDYAVACKAAANKGITVSTIHCGNEAQGIAGKWKDGALLADGSYLCIDQNRAVADVPTPHDKPLAELSAKLSSTYVPYGEAKKREEFAQNQQQQDKNAEQSSLSAAAGRAGSKVSSFYRNSDWDLVDAVREKKVKLEDVKDEQLPPDLRGKSLAEKQAFLDKKFAEREAMKEEIKKLTGEREKCLAEERAKSKEAKQDTLGDAVVKEARRQAEKKGYHVEK